MKIHKYSQTYIFWGSKYSGDLFSALHECSISCYRLRPQVSMFMVAGCTL